MKFKFPALILVAFGFLGQVTAAQDKPGAKPAAPTPQAARQTKTLFEFRLVPIQEAKLSANKPGSLVELPAIDGQSVEKGDVLGQIDDRESQANIKAAKAELAVAEKQASSDAPVQAAEATQQVAEQEWLKSKAINETKANAVNVIELERLRLTMVKAGFQIAVAAQEYDVAKLNIGVKDAQREVAELDAELRKIRAPFSGEIVKVDRHLGEWLQAGDHVLHLVQMDRLRVQGYLSIQHKIDESPKVDDPELAKELAKEPAVDPSEIIGRECDVIVMLPKGKTTTFKSKVGFVSPYAEGLDAVRVWVEIENRKENGRWVAVPGQMATVKIQLDPPPKPKADPKAPAGKPEVKPATSGTTGS